ncbi:hypothetical protein [Stenomitos frigidus]|nr:hypothetical protein [Stenomitos frigidus]
MPNTSISAQLSPSDRDAVMQVIGPLIYTLARTGAIALWSQFIYCVF